MENRQAGKFQFTKWLKRLGVAGFVFFLVKGLLWLLVPLLIGYSFWK
jgi:hypothetical protein